MIEFDHQVLSNGVITSVVVEYERQSEGMGILQNPTGRVRIGSGTWVARSPEWIQAIINASRYIGSTPLPKDFEW